jgi:dTDP-4-dehydrorhamnose 3,5-epimerase
MHFTRLEIPDVFLVEPQVFEDPRGFFLESYHKGQFTAAGLQADSVEFVQDNHSGSRRGSVRGLHYQIRQPQGKLVRVIAGEAYDVAVDLRRHSPTFGRWVGCTLSAQMRNQLWIPPGFAHGFYVISEWAEILYKATDYYAPQWERSLLWNDPAIGVRWPLSPGDEGPVLSDKDRNGTPLAQAEVYE